MTSMRQQGDKTLTEENERREGGGAKRQQYKTPELRKLMVDETDGKDLGSYEVSNQAAS